MLCFLIQDILWMLQRGGWIFFASIMQVWKDMGEIGLEKDIYLTFFNGVWLQESCLRAFPPQNAFCKLWSPWSKISTSTVQTTNRTFSSLTCGNFLNFHKCQNITVSPLLCRHCSRTQCRGGIKALNYIRLASFFKLSPIVNLTLKSLKCSAVYPYTALNGLLKYKFVPAFHL